MLIYTQWGWRFLRHENHRRARKWKTEGKNIDEQKAKMEEAGGYFGPERSYSPDLLTKRRLLAAAKHRAKKTGVTFCIHTGHFEIPEFCPLRLVPLQMGRGRLCDDSPSLDRKDPRLGYIPGNVWVISHKANRLKGDFTPEELRVFCENVLEADWMNWNDDSEKQLHMVIIQSYEKQQKSRWWKLV